MIGHPEIAQDEFLIIKCTQRILDFDIVLCCLTYNQRLRYNQELHSWWSGRDCLAEAVMVYALCMIPRLSLAQAGEELKPAGLEVSRCL